MSSDWWWMSLVFLGGFCPQEREVPEVPTMEVGDYVIAPVAPGPTGLVRRLLIEEAEPLTLCGESASLDLRLRVEDLEGQVLAEDDDSGIATNAHLTWQPEVPGEYVVRLLASEEVPFPAYLMVVRGSHDPSPPDPELADRNHWESALVFALQDDREARVEECLRHLVEHRRLSPVVLRLGYGAAATLLDRIQVLIDEAQQAVKKFRPELARERLAEALRLGTALRDGGFPAIAARSFRSLAAAGDQSGQLQLTAEALRLQLDYESRVRSGYDLYLLQSYMNLAVAMSSLDDLGGGRAFDERTLVVLRSVVPPTHRQLATLELNLAFKVKEMGDLTLARLLEEAVLSRLEGRYPEDHDTVQQAIANLAVTMGRLGMVERASELYRRRFAHLERTRSPDDLMLLGLRSELDLEEGTPEALERAVAVRRKILAVKERTMSPLHPDLIRARDELGYALSRRGGAGDEGRSLRLQALREWQIVYSPGHPDVLTALTNFAWNEKRRKNDEAVVMYLTEFFEGALHRLRMARSLSRREARAVAMGEEADHREALGLFQTVAGDSRLAFTVFRWLETRRLVTTGTRVVAGSSEDPALAPLHREVSAACEGVATLVAGSAEPDSVRVREAVTRRDRAERDLFEARGGEALEVSIPSLAAVLPADGVAVGFVYHPRYLWHTWENGTIERAGAFTAYVVRRDQGLHRIELGYAWAIEKAVHRWRAAIGAPVPLDPGEDPVEGDLDPAVVGEELRQLILDPILQHLKETNPFGLPEPKHFFVCLDDVLHLVPLDCLPLGRSLVGERYEIHREVSFARLLAPPPPISGERSLLAMGEIAFDGEGWTYPSAESITRSAGESFEHLPATGDEAETVGRLFEASFASAPLVIRGRGASKSALRLLAPRSRFLHLATHGYFREPDWIEPQNAVERDVGAPSLPVRELAPLSFCGLALAGANLGSDEAGRLPGIITAEEIARLDLSRCELAVLSACESGVGLRAAGEGVASLQAAFQAGGVHSTIAALWEVEDTTARAFMEEFYRLWWSEGGERLTRSQALWRARLRLRRAQKPIREWAAWVLTGDPD